jgi:hypothetical protein
MGRAAKSRSNRSDGEKRGTRTAASQPGHAGLGEHTLELAAALTRLADAVENLGSAGDLATVAAGIARLADHFAPAPSDIVGSEYVARKLGCTTTWIAEMVRKGEIPRSCVVQGTGNGRPWKFHKARIEAWIARR